jgi:ArsR family transcriptional regulator
MSGAHEPAANLQTLAEQLKVLADPTRLIVFDLLMQGVQCNCKLSEELKLTPNLISHHLRVLSEAGLVDTERDAYDARWVYYSADENALQKLVAAFNAFFDPSRIKRRRPNCGPQVPYALDVDLAISEGRPPPSYPKSPNGGGGAL